MSDKVYLLMEKFENEKQYWLEKLSGEIDAVTLPADGHRTAGHGKKSVPTTFDNELQAELSRISKNNDLSLYVILVAAFKVLVFNYTGREDIFFLSPMHVKDESNFNEFIVLRDRVDLEMTFLEVLMAVKKTVEDGYINQHYPMQKIFDELGIDDYRRSFGNIAMRLDGIHKEMPAFNDITLSFSKNGNGLENEILYNSALYKETTIRGMGGLYQRVLKWVLSNIKVPLYRMELLEETEKQTLLDEFNAPETVYPGDKTVPQLFEDMVRLHPDNTAVLFEGEPLTYDRLNRRADRIARMLIDRGALPGTFVGIVLETSDLMVTAIMAVLKAGCGYLPIDPGAPGERVKYMLEDSAVSIVLTRRAHGEMIEKRNTAVLPVFAEDAEGENGPVDSDMPRVKSGPNPAYLIYTSGTTGRSKAVLAHQAGLINYTHWRISAYNHRETDVALQLLSYSFDGFNSNFYSTLLSAGTLVLVPDNKKLEMTHLVELIRANGVTNLSLVPGMYESLLNNDTGGALKSLRFVVLAGEKAPPRLIAGNKEKYPGMLIINEYGPTECTVTAAANIGMEPGQTSIIGKPIDNARIYILNFYKKLVPVGMVGEITIGGAGVTDGYLNNPLLTAEKFIENPYKPGETLYKTGDLGRWDPDGNIEFFGRVDHQVKVRGFRIELGEIEGRLAKHPGINNAVVFAVENGSGNNELCAYIVLQTGAFEKQSPMDELREYLALGLPDYMIPSYFVQLEEIPLTPNGKVDRNVLPAPEIQSAGYEAPGNEIEEKLVEIWSDVLAGPVGINDNFFKMGGDSIKAIQVSSRLRAHRLDLKINDLFSNPTIKQAATCVNIVPDSKARHSEHQGIVRGRVPLTPIQHWFFERFPAHRNHFNHSVMLYNKEGFDTAVLTGVFSKIAEHHDALRMVYTVNGSEITQENRGTGGQLFDLEVIDLREGDDVEAAVAEEAGRINKAIDLNAGPLLKLGLFKTRQGDHLLIVIHHLVVDGISWRILLEDFSTGYALAGRGEAVEFPEKTHPFKEWALRINEYAQSPEILGRTAYWKAVENTEFTPLPKDNEVGPDRLILENRGSREFLLTAEETDILLTGTHHAYTTEINDILLAALGMALEEWAGIDRAVINLEGHGREEIFDGMDIGRTVGWFTSQFPVLLDMSGARDISHRVKTVKEALRRVPGKGVGYGILRYLTPMEKKENTRFALHPEISFNYLGQFHRETRNELFEISTLYPGDPVSPGSPQQHTLEINGMVADGRLSLAFAYNKFQFKESTVEKLVDRYGANLRAIIGHCAGKSESELTPSDMTYAGLDLQQLEDLRHRIGIEHSIRDIYPLAPMQGGMYFHAASTDHSTAYFEQMVLSLTGKIDLPLFRESVNILVQRYDVLRTVFVHESLEDPLQIVLDRRPLTMGFEDLSSLPREDRDAYIDTYKRKDIETGFDLLNGPLINSSLFQLDNQPPEYKLVWSFHHILMDGWCMGILLNDLLNIYKSLGGGRSPVEGLPPVTPYKRYILWLSKRNKEGELSYWRSYLEGYEQEVFLPGEVPLGPETREDVFIGHHKTGFTPSVSRALEETARTNQVTPSTLFQVLWGLLVQRYNNTGDIVFGAVVSGRPTDIEGVENMVGLFINTIPVRIRLGEIKTVSGLLRETQRQNVESGPREYLPLAEIQSVSPLKNRLVRHLMVFENYPMDESLLGGLSGNTPDAAGFEITGMEIREETDYDFNLIVSPGERFRLDFNYNVSVFDKIYIERMALHFEQVLAQVLRNPDMDPREIDIITADEKQEILSVFNASAADYPSDRTIQGLFEDRVEMSPDAAAVVEPVELTYKELDTKSGRLAGLLRRKGVRPGTVAVIMVERSIEMVIGILGILKAGGAYLPVEPGYPEDRVKFLIEDSNAKLVLTRGTSDTPPVTGREIIDPGDPGIYRDDLRQPEKEIGSGPADLAYVIYTSGSTGKPKGVMLDQFSAVNLLVGMQRAYPLVASDTYLLKTPCVFDVSVTELFGWFIGSGKLAILENGGEKDPRIILDAIERNNVTHINFVPSMFTLFLELAATENLARLSSLKYIFLAGEALPPESVEKFRALNIPAALENIYGPTEGTVYSSRYSLSAWNGKGGIPIGKPVQNVGLYILGGDNHLQPIGAPGELCISGTGVARGYLNRPELTANRFYRTYKSYRSDKTYIPLFYKTGDLARWKPDGNIEFLGRIDHQVKIRGYRVELGEIENYLLKHHHIRDAVVLAYEDGTGDKGLAAYIVSDEELSGENLRNYLLTDLPDYMVPSLFTRMEKMPRTSTGKIDRGVLPLPGTETNAGYTAPVDPVEKSLVKIWAGLLGKEEETIGTTDNFFQLGGHSLKAAGLVLKIHRLFNVKMPLSGIFKQPTISGLSRFIKEAVKERYRRVEIVEEKEYYELSSAQKRLYYLQQIDKKGTAYHITNMWVIDGEVVRERLEESIRALIHRHGSLRTGFQSINGELVQRIHKAVNFNVEYYDIPGDDTRRSRAIKTFVRPFDLGRAPLMRVGLFRTPGDSILVVDIHHIVSDGVSMSILANDFTTFYRGGEPRPLRVQYNDYCQWQNNRAGSEEMKKQDAFWRKEFEGKIPVLDLPTENPRPAMQSFDGGRVNFTLDEAETAALNRVAAENGATLFMVLLALYNILLSKLGGGEDIVVGVPIAGRGHEELHPVVGMFVNTLALRNHPTQDKTFTGFLKEVREKTLRVFENQDYLFEDLVERLDAPKDLSRHPVFTVVFAMQNMGDPGPEAIEGLTLRPVHGESDISKFDLTMSVFEESGKLDISFEYCTALFSRPTIERFGRYFREIAGQTAAGGSVTLEKISVSHDLFVQKLVIPEDDGENFGF